MWIRCFNKSVVHSRHFVGFGVNHEEVACRPGSGAIEKQTVYFVCGGYQYKFGDRLSETSPDRGIADYLLEELCIALSERRHFFDVIEETKKHRANHPEAESEVK